MIIYNTTFHMQADIEREIVGWLRDTCIREALRHGMSAPMLARLVDHVDEGAVSMALHLHAKDESVSDIWHEYFSDTLLPQLYNHWEGSVVAFSTRMESIEL